MKEKCSNMQKLVVLLYLIVITDFGVSLTSLLASRQYCGFPIDEYQKMKTVLTIDKFPWLVQLLYDEDKVLKCTGSLINDRYVLTAAHCLKAPLDKLIAVRLGAYDCVESSDNNENCSNTNEEVDVEEKIPHRGFREGSGLHDIGLIRLIRSVQYSEYIRPICLPLPINPGISLYEDTVLSGWRLLNKTTATKKKILSNFMDYEKCKVIHLNFTIVVTPLNVCATGNEKHNCQEDSGGPLIFSRNGQWIQIGILSFAKDCGSTFPSVYTITSEYLRWLQQNIRN